jgi:hypothetical protein
LSKTYPLWKAPDPQYYFAAKVKPVAWSDVADVADSVGFLTAAAVAAVGFEDDIGIVEVHCTVSVSSTSGSQ